MEVPEGVSVENCISARAGVNESGMRNAVCMLKKSLYGLKQAPRCWDMQFKTFLRKYSFKECEADKCIYVGEHSGCRVFLALFVDDGLLACKSSDVLRAILADWSKEYDITTGDASYFVGMQIRRDRNQNCMYINQSDNICEIVDKFDMSEAKAFCVPADPNVNLLPADDDKSSVNYLPYHEVIGSLMYLAIVSRPDIAFAVSKLS